MMISPLAELSYRFHGLAKNVVHGLQKKQAQKSLGTPQAQTWTTLGQTLEKRGSLPLVSVIGPRWNCHAQIASIGPLAVRDSLTCCVGELGASADSWSIVAYDDDSRTVAWSGSADTPGSDLTWKLRPGNYKLIMRVYVERDEFVVPEVIVDGRPLACARTIRGEARAYQSYLSSIKDRSGPYYRLLHYHAFYHLKHASRPRDWVRRQFLPVGNPDTDWHYGHLDPRERLQVYFEASEQQRVATYISFYNWASFPVHWCKIVDARWVSPRFEQPVAYAIRRVRIGAADQQAALGPCEIRVLGAAEP